MIQKGIACGICKLNINTDLQIVWSKAVREFLQENESVYDPRKIIKAGEQALKAKKKMEICQIWIYIFIMMDYLKKRKKL